MTWIAQLMLDERGSPSSKRLVGVLCALALCYALVGSGRGGWTPDSHIVDVITGLAIAALGMTSIDKATVKTGAKEG